MRGPGPARDAAQDRDFWTYVGLFLAGVVLIVGGLYLLPAQGSAFTYAISDGTRTVVCDRLIHAPVGVIIKAPAAGEYSVDVSRICAMEA